MIARRWVAFLFHAPGLWLFFRFELSRALQRQNAVAASSTLLAMGAAWFARGLPAMALTWAVGHVLWGAWLAAMISADRWS